MGKQDEKHAAQVLEAFSRLSRHLHAADLPYDLTPEKLSTLATVSAREPISVSALAKAEIVSLPTMSNMVTKLVAEGLVERAEDQNDARGVLVSTTAKGKVIYQRAAQQSLSNLKSTLSNLKFEQLATIRKLLSTLEGPEASDQASEAERLYAIAPVGLCYFDTDLRYLYINEWLANINGLPVEAHLGDRIDEVVRDIAVDVVPQLKHVIQSGEPVIEGEVEARHRPVQESRGTTCITTIQTRARTARS